MLSLLVPLAGRARKKAVFGKTGGKIGDGTFGNGRKARRESRRAKIYADRGRPDADLSVPEDAVEEQVAEPAKLSMREVFGPDGFLEKCMRGGFDRTTVTSDYEYRPAQLEMAELVHDAFETRHHAIVEAGTGTGKTLAYLLPAICSGRRVVISTATKSLQEQLYQKDIPFLQKHFART